jgi:hypothetical protein
VRSSRSIDRLFRRARQEPTQGGNDGTIVACWGVRFNEPSPSRGAGRHLWAKSAEGYPRFCSTLRSITACTATMIDDTPISSADHSGRSKMPKRGQRTPAATVMARML